MTRFHELDLWRGLAVVSMVIYHFFFDLNFLGLAPREMYAGGWLVFQRMIASSFLLLVGISLTISFSHARDKPFFGVFKKFLKRAGFVMAAALLVTLGTGLFVPEQYVRFGILHLISVSTIIAVPFLFIRPAWITAILGAVSIYFGAFIKTLSVSHPFLLWLGVAYPGFATVDYFPVVPWFGIVLIGIFAGKWMYPDGTRKYHWLSVPSTPDNRPQTILAWVGRKALWIYLIHQPVLIGVLTVWASI